LCGEFVKIYERESQQMAIKKITEIQNQTACGHPTLKDGWGMLRAARPHARFYGIQKSSSFRCSDPLDRNYRNSVFGSQRVLVNQI
jgi:hypothetical protein